jgi:hypothetical protein
MQPCREDECRHDSAQGALISEHLCVDEHGEEVALAQAAHNPKHAATPPSRICSALFVCKRTGKPHTPTWPPLYCVSNSAWSIPATEVTSTKGGEESNKTALICSISIHSRNI